MVQVEALSEREVDVLEYEPIRICRILLIEDNKSDVLLLRKALRQHIPTLPLEFVDVPRMADALALLDIRPYDLILLDLNLLDVEGVASVAALRDHVERTPIIVHTGADDLQLKKEALMCGAKNYWVKGKEYSIFFGFIVEQALNTQLR